MTGSAGAAIGSVTFVGAGPGAADLLTLRGATAIRDADLVIWASSLVHPDVLLHAREGAELIDSARLPMEGVLTHYERAAREGLRVARVHSGDPCPVGSHPGTARPLPGAWPADRGGPRGLKLHRASRPAIGRELTIPRWPNR